MIRYEKWLEVQIECEKNLGYLRKGLGILKHDIEDERELDYW